MTDTTAMVPSDLRRGLGHGLQPREVARGGLDGGNRRRLRVEGPEHRNLDDGAVTSPLHNHHPAQFKVGNFEG